MSKYSEHPFTAWLGSLATLNGVTLDGTRNSDIKLSGIAAKRFALGVYDGAPLLAILAEDQAAFQAVKWTSAAIIINRDFSDWIALSAKDVRAGSQEQGEPVPMRLFIPIQLGRLSAWKENNKNTFLHIAAMNPTKMGPLQTDETPFMKLQALIMVAPDSRQSGSKVLQPQSSKSGSIPSARI